MRTLVLLVLGSISGATFAASIQAPGVTAGPDAGPTTKSPIASLYNPAALAGADGHQGIFDVQAASIRVDVNSWRNGGFDPNTGEAYNTATARVLVPVTFLGLSHEILDDRLTAGLALTTPFLGGGDYTSSEDNPPPFTSHQRYFGVNTKVITAQVIPAIGFTPIQDVGIHLGAGFTYTLDMVSAEKTSNTGREGLFVDGSGERHPYADDPVLKASATGSHMGWNVGVLIDHFELAQLGVSYTPSGDFHAEGEATVEFPESLNSTGERLKQDGTFVVDLKLPAIWRAGLNSQISDKFNIGFSLEHAQWNKCCGTEDGDIHFQVAAKGGNAFGSESDDRVTTSVAKDQYSPRRLWDSNNVALFSGYQMSEALWFGGRVGYNQNAVPDYAVSATNLDFENAGFMVASRYRMGKERGLILGLAYSKFFLMERRVSGTAWGSDAPDERFAPTEPPFNVSGDGYYRGKVDIVGVRIGWDA